MKYLILMICLLVVSGCGRVEQSTKVIVDNNDGSGEAIISNNEINISSGGNQAISDEVINYIDQNFKDGELMLAKKIENDDYTVYSFGGECVLRTGQSVGEEYCTNIVTNDKGEIIFANQGSKAQNFSIGGMNFIEVTGIIKEIRDGIIVFYSDSGGLAQESDIINGQKCLIVGGGESNRIRYLDPITQRWILKSTDKKIIRNECDNNKFSEDKSTTKTTYKRNINKINNLSGNMSNEQMIDLLKSNLNITEDVNQLTEKSDRYIDTKLTYKHKNSLLSKENEGCQGDSYGECVKKYRDKHTLSKAQACSKIDGLYQNYYLQVGADQGFSVVAHGFYKKGNIITYSIITSPDPVTHIESNGLDKYLYEYTCNNKKSNNLLQFPQSIWNIYSVISTYGNKILLYNTPHEGPHNFLPYDGYLTFDKNSNTLSHIILFSHYNGYGSQLPWSQLTTLKTQKTLLEDSRSQCKDEYGCNLSYVINTITDSKINITLTVTNEDNDTLSKQYEIQY